MDFAGDAPDAYGEEAPGLHDLWKTPTVWVHTDEESFFVLCNGKREMRGQDIFCFFIHFLMISYLYKRFQYNCYIIFFSHSL